MEKNKFKSICLVLLMAVFMMSLCACAIKGDSDDKNKIDRKVPESMNDLNIISADTVKWTRFDENEMEITDKDTLDTIKDVFDNIKISKDDEYGQYEGGIQFDLYAGDKQLCFINLAGSAETGRCIITNDTYKFIGEISKDDANKLIDVIGKYNNINEEK